MISPTRQLTISDQPPVVNGLANRRDPFAFFTRLAAEAGSFVSYELPSETVYFVNDPVLIRKVLVEEDAKFVKWAFNPKWHEAFGEGVLLSEGPLHRRMRRLARPAFRPDRLPDYARTMIEVTQRRLSTWRDDGAMEIDREMVLLTLEIVSGTLFGVTLGDWLERVRAASRTAQLLSDRLGNAPADNRLFASAVEELEGVSRFILEERRRTGQADEDLLALLFAGQETAPEIVTDEQICQEIRSFLLAGHITIANVLAAACWHLAREPEMFAALRQSLDQSLGDRVPGLGDLPALSFCEHLMLETLRLYPPVWALGREARREVEIGGHPIPEGAKLVIVPWVLHRDAGRFPEPDRFMPSRWRNDLRARLPRGSYLPFSAGARGCLGEHYAMLEGTLLLAFFASRWQFRELPERPDPGWSPQIILWPRRGVRLHVTRRAAAPPFPP